MRKGAENSSKQYYLEMCFGLIFELRFEASEIFRDRYQQPGDGKGQEGINRF